MYKGGDDARCSNLRSGSSLPENILANQLKITELDGTEIIGIYSECYQLSIAENSQKTENKATRTRLKQAVDNREPCFRVETLLFFKTILSGSN